MPFPQKILTPKLLMFICIILTASRIDAQTNSCKAKLKANRNKVVSSKLLGYKSYNYHPWNTDDITITQYFGAEAATKRADIIITDKKGRFPDVISPRVQSKITYIGNKNNIYIDSFDDKRQYRHRNFYYGLNNLENFDNVIWTKNVTENYIVFYNINGYDSAKLTYNSQGIFIESLLFDGAHWGDANEIICKKQFDEKGIIVYKDSLGNHFNYTNGVLTFSAIDTVMKKYGKVRYECTYYVNGNIESKKYFKEYGMGSEAKRIPYLKWVFYNIDGTIKNTQQKSSKIYDTVNDPPKVSPPMSDKVFATVEQMPEFGLGYKNLEPFINAKVQDILCESKLELSGKYEINFSITTDGIAHFISAEGFNADQLSKVIEDMPKWKPGKVNGRMYNGDFVIKITIDKNTSK